jgi:carbon storage regulator
MGTLVIRRRVGEAIAIGGGIEIEVIDISRTRVKLGIRAPRTTPVMRAEAITVAAENRSACAFLAARGMKDVEQIVHTVRSVPAKSA